MKCLIKTTAFSILTTASLSFNVVSEAQIVMGESITLPNNNIVDNSSMAEKIRTLKIEIETPYNVHYNKETGWEVTESWTTTNVDGETGITGTIQWKKKRENDNNSPEATDCEIHNDKQIITCLIEKN